jgi:hypothetical protein
LYDLRVEKPATSQVAKPTVSPLPAAPSGGYTSSYVGQSTPKIDQQTAEDVFSKMMAERELDTITVDMWEK